MNFQTISARDFHPPLWTPKLLDKPSAWWGHVPFAFWITEASRPRTLVELGTHYGVSYAAFCEAVAQSGLATRCYAVDSWKGDDQATYYGNEVYEGLRAFHDQNYASFSELIRVDFDAICNQFADASIDLLHIDGFHTYEAVRHDFETWRPKLTLRGVVLFHDTNVRRDQFGVWRLFDEVSKSRPSFEFLHSFGLGVLAVGPEAPEAVKLLCELTEDSEIASVREAFSSSGSIWMNVNDARIAGERLRERSASMIALSLSAKRRSSSSRKSAIGSLSSATRSPSSATGSQSSAMRSPSSAKRSPSSATAWRRACGDAV